MSANIVNQVSFLRTSREFPEELVQLTREVSKSYIDIANTVNNRIISIFPTNRPAVNGENWFLTTQRQQGLRQVYTFTSTGNIAHNLNFSSIPSFTRCFGAFTDGTNWYGLIFGSNITIAGQVSFYITNTNIVIQSGVGSPSISSGIVVLEWLSNSLNLGIA